ncbi:MAG: 2-oxo acid dehydrogenase subunit E2 [Rubrivivax sp.]|nr:2-oxo acid dehydrogenase subunit E2 [Rubrivivax sp.]
MIEFRLPSLGSDMDDGTLVEWRVRPGDAVHKGQVVAVVDTTKAAIDVECWDEGFVHALLVEPGTRLPVGATMAVLRGATERAADVEREWAAVLARRRGASASLAAPAMGAAIAVGSTGSTGSARPAPMPAVPAPQPGAGAVPLAAKPSTPATAVAGPTAAATCPARRVSPAARRLAREHGLDLANVPAPRDLVSLEHVQAALQATLQTRAAMPAGTAPVAAAPPGAAAAAAAPSPATRAQAMRQTIAAAMSRSKREIPHYYLAEEIEFERGAAWLAQRNSTLPAAQRLMPAALLLKAVAFALRRYPEFNGFWRDSGREGAFVAGAGVHIGVAISLRERGLVAPAVHDADRQDVATLTRSLLDLVKRTRAGALRSSELADPTITVTNLGDQGVASVFGVIYPPQVALVGFGRIASRPLVAEDGRLVAVPMLTATLAADHRASDGHRGALLLAEVRALLQDPPALDRPWGEAASAAKE